MAPVCPPNGQAGLQLQMSAFREGGGLARLQAAAARQEHQRWDGGGGLPPRRKLVATSAAGSGLGVGNRGGMELSEAGKSIWALPSLPK